MSSQNEQRDITIDTLSTPPARIKPAPLVRRTAAAMIDLLILAVLWLILSMAYGYNPAHIMVFLDYDVFGSLAILTFLYYFFLEGLFAATIGKSVTKLTVLESSGDVCSFGASFKRNLLRFIDWLPVLYIVGAIAVLLSTDRQRIGDRVARTVVTLRPERDPNPPSAPFLFH